MGAAPGGRGLSRMAGSGRTRRMNISTSPAQPVCCAQLGQGARRDEPALVQQAEAVAQALGLVEAVRRQDDGLALLAEVRDELGDDLAAEDVQAERRLVEQQHGRAGGSAPAPG